MASPKLLPDLSFCLHVAKLSYIQYLRRQLFSEMVLSEKIENYRNIAITDQMNSSVLHHTNTLPWGICVKMPLFEFTSTLMIHSKRELSRSSSSTALRQFYSTVLDIEEIVFWGQTLTQWMVTRVWAMCLTDTSALWSKWQSTGRMGLWENVTAMGNSQRLGVLAEAKSNQSRTSSLTCTITNAFVYASEKNMRAQ